MEAKVRNTFDFRCVKVIIQLTGDRKVGHGRGGWKRPNELSLVIHKCKVNNSALITGARFVKSADDFFVQEC